MSTDPYSSLVDAWARTSSRMFSGLLEANRAAMTAFAPPSDAPTGQRTTGGTRTEDRIEPAGDLPEWQVERSTSETLGVGDFVRFTKTLSEADVERFAAASGDTNPLHLDAEAAGETRFGGRIVHGVLAAGLISAALARFPGNVVYLSQEVEFLGPVRIGDRISAECEIVEALGGGRFRVKTTVKNPEETVIDGEAVVLIED